MPGKDLHAQPFTEETLAKLRIFENYTQEWIPTFVMSGYSEICIFDFFAGTGYDKIGISGSPIRILEQVAKNSKILFEENTKVNLYFNEFVTDKYESLVRACKSFMRLLQFVWRGWEESKQRFSPFPRVATPCNSRISAGPCPACSSCS